MQDRRVRRHSGREAGYRATEAVTPSRARRTGHRQVVIRVEAGRRSAVDEQQAPGSEPTLKRPGEIIEDLELDERTSATVQGGDGIAGESQNSSLSKNIEIS